jgi:hypothetical protein
MPPDSGTIFGREPVAILAVVQGAITLLVTFGLHLTAEQIGAIVTFSGLVLALVARSRVSPV